MSRTRTRKLTIARRRKCRRRAKRHNAPSGAWPCRSSTALPRPWRASSLPRACLQRTADLGPSQASPCSSWPCPAPGTGSGIWSSRWQRGRRSARALRPWHASCRGTSSSETSTGTLRMSMGCSWSGRGLASSCSSWACCSWWGRSASLCGAVIGRSGPRTVQARRMSSTPRSRCRASSRQRSGRSSWAGISAPCSACSGSCWPSASVALSTASPCLWSRHTSPRLLCSGWQETKP
mmetsp:Transcript_70181/g.180903  ORF Transcript_70181/g.180903 Transcript_70181/m.180903 type:complete len:236 (+) Transcript_70181:229-936(+)